MELADMSPRCSMNVTIASGTMEIMAVATSPPSRSPHAPQKPHTSAACWKMMTSPVNMVSKWMSG